MNNSEKEKIIDFVSGLPDVLKTADVKKQIADFVNAQPEKLKPWKSSVGRIAFALSLLFGVYAILRITDFFRLDFSAKLEHVSKFDVIAYCAFIVIPLSWFLLEYIWLFPDRLKLDSDELSDLKYTHELAGKIWAGVVVLITAILWLKYGTGNLFPGRG